MDSPPLPPVDPQLSENLKTIFETTRSSMANLYSGKHVDNRPASVVTYAIHSGADSDLVKSLVLEIVIQHCSDPGKAHLRILAQKEFLSLLSNQSVRADIEVSVVCVCVCVCAYVRACVRACVCGWVFGGGCAGIP